MDAFEMAISRAKKETAQRQAEKDHVVRDMKTLLRPLADMARGQIKEIEAAYLNASAVVAKVRQTTYAKDLDIDRWMMEIEGLGQVPQVLREAIKEFESLCWDHVRNPLNDTVDLNRRPAIVADLRTRFMQGRPARRAIEEAAAKITSRVVKEEKREEEHLNSTGARSSVQTSLVPPEKKRPVPSKDSQRFDPRL